MFLVGRNRVEILQKFDNSVLIRYVKSGIEACVNPSLIKSKVIEEYKKKGSDLKKPQQKKPFNNQLNLEL